MKMMKHIQTWLLITLLALSANGAVSAKVASGGINLSNEVHQGLNDSKSLNALGISDVSTIHALSSSIVPNAGVYRDPNGQLRNPNGTFASEGRSTAKTTTSSSGVLHKNNNNYKGDQSVYEITIDGKLHKFGKADGTDLAANGNPNRLESQVNKLQKKNPNSEVDGSVIYNNENITTKNIKKVETDQVQNYVDEFGDFPPGNQNHPGIKLPE